MFVVRDEEFLVAGVPEQRELAVQHDCGQFGHLIDAVAGAAEFGAAAVFFYAGYAAGVADGEAGGRELCEIFFGEDFFDVPHNYRIGMSRARSKGGSVRDTLDG
jgi:hypothetical protein